MARDIPLNSGETAYYDIYFKWGILMSHAGEGVFSFSPATYQGREAFSYRLVFRSNGIIESIYRMRDTINCYYSTDYSLIHSAKHTNEGGYYLIDELTFTRTNGRTLVHSRRYTPDKVKIDTTLTVASGSVSDMLGSIFFLRTLDWERLETDRTFPLSVAVGRDVVKAVFRYQGEALVKHGKVTYNTHHFLIDISDEAFTQTKSAAELWVGNDENHLPIKVRSKLKVGYAEVMFNHATQLKAPMNCVVKTEK